MSSWGFAPRVTQISFSAAATTEVEEGEPIRIWGYTVANIDANGATSVTLRSADGNTNYAVHSIADNSTFISDVSWIADKGLEVVTSGGGAADIEVSIFHGAPGS